MSVSKLSCFPYEVTYLDPETTKRISKTFSGSSSQLIQIGPQKMLMPEGFINEALYCRNFPFRESDCLVMGYPRSGTTMTQELLWLLFNDFNINSGKSVIERVPLLESRALILEKPRPDNEGELKQHITKLLNSPKILEGMTNRRVIKTHLHFDFLPKNLLTCGCKIIYIARNPKDVIVSNYNFSLFMDFKPKENFESFLDSFLSDLIYWGPYWTHLQQGWDLRFSPNVLFFFYDDFLQNRKYYIEKILDFVGEKVTPFQMDVLDFSLEFKNFKKYMSQSIVDKILNSQENSNNDYVRAGNSGGWKTYFTEEMNAKVDKWIEENLERTGIEFPKGLF